jgi:uncharacterized protein DUF3560
MTTREKREARAARLRGWAEAREAKQPALTEAARGDEAATGIPFGQPILVGHHSERGHRRALDRIDRAMGAAVENAGKARDMAERAASIEAQNAAAIYTDDDDAKEKLAEKIATLEAERDRIKAYNASCRKAAKTGGTGDMSLLDEKQRADLLGIARACAYQLRPGAAAPAYWTSNLSGNIGRLRKRLDGLDAAKARQAAGRIISARFAGTCAECSASIERGQTIRYSRQDGARCAPACETNEED